MGSFPTRPFQESKPQNDEPDEFLSKPRRKTKIPPSIKISTPTGCRRPAFTTPQSTRTNVDKSMLWSMDNRKTGSLRGDFHGQIMKNYKERKRTVL